MSQSRQLAAIMFTDIVGYTALMGKDSRKAMDLVRQSKKIQKSLVEKHNGKWLKEIGDGAMAQFNTALDAVNCAVQIQRTSRADFEGDLRIGIHLGDITIENDDVYGDGVNIAARLESIADPGGIYISESIEKAIQGQTNVQAKYLGEVKLKNVAYGVRTYAIQGVGLPLPEVKEDKKLSGHFWAEVQRKGVIRAAIAYVITGLLLVLLLRETQNWITLPDWSLTAVLASLLIGFPIAMYMAWNYERSPEGFVRTSSRESWQNPYSRAKRKPLTGSFVIAGLMLVIAFMYFYPSFLANPLGDSGVSDEVIITDKSIAVIPFKNLSSDEDSQYFCDGMMDAILSHLSKISELRVISRTSMERYRNSQKSIPEIATELKVSSLLEGSFQRNGDTVRIIVQLINGKTDKHMWSETYTKELTGIFGVQSDIAKQISTTLQTKLTPLEDELLGVEPTQNQLAYDYYLKGEDYYVRSREKPDYLFAIQMFKRAVDADPSFILAWVGLAKSCRTLHHFHISPEHMQLAKDYLDRAIALNPELMEVQVETGTYYYHCELDYKKALEILNKVKDRYTNNDELYMTIGHIYRRMGQYDEALERQNKAILLSPFDWTHWNSRSYTLTILGRYFEAEKNLKKVIELNPSLESGYSDLAKLHLITGDTVKVERILSSGLEIGPIVRSHFEMIKHNYAEAVKTIEASNLEVVANQFLYEPKSLQLALIHYVASNMASADQYFQQSIQILKESLKKYPEDSRIYSSLGIAYAGLGRNEQAIHSGKKALSIMNFSVDALKGFQRELDMARILLLLGEYDQVIPKLEFLIQQSGYLSVELLKSDPFWNPLKKMSAFKSLVSHPNYQISEIES